MSTTPGALAAATPVTTVDGPARPVAAPRSRRSRRRGAARRRGMSPPLSLLVYASLVTATVAMLLPLVVIIPAAFKGEREFRTTSVFTPPQSWLHIDNFVTAFSAGGMAQGLLNTSIILGLSLLGTVLIGSMAAYAIDRYAFRLRRLVLALFLLATLVPGVTTQVATFRIINFLELFNTRWSAIVLFMGTDIVSIYIFWQFLRGIPRELDEAAEIDGAGPWTVYWRIILPILRPAVATVVIVKGVAIYNEFYIPFLYMPSRDLSTISTSLFRFSGPFSAQQEIILAGTLLVILPTLVMFLALQRHIYNGFTSGASK